MWRRESSTTKENERSCKKNHALYAPARDDGASCGHSKPEQNHRAEARNALADFFFPWSSRTALQASTHSLQIYARMEPSAGFAMSVSTCSWVLLQNEHRRISSWRLKIITSVWRGRNGSQDSLMSKSAMFIELKMYRFSEASKDVSLRSQKIARKAQPRRGLRIAPG